MTGPRAATVQHTHLFAGARIDLGQEAVGPGTLSVRLSDGVVVEAELIDLDGAGAWVVAAAGFVTAAGASIAPKVWSVREIVNDAGDQILVLGPRTGLQRDPQVG